MLANVLLAIALCLFRKKILNIFQIYFYIEFRHGGYCLNNIQSKLSEDAQIYYKLKKCRS